MLNYNLMNFICIPDEGIRVREMDGQVHREYPPAVREPYTMCHHNGMVAFVDSKGQYFIGPDSAILPLNLHEKPMYVALSQRPVELLDLYFWPPR